MGGNKKENKKSAFDQVYALVAGRYRLGLLSR
jgi:hypothetical protein